MTLEDLIGPMVLGTYALMMLLEAVFPARTYPARRLWRLLGWGFLIAVALIATVVPLLLPVSWLARHKLLDGSVLGTGWGTVVGFAAVSLVNYGWHRTAHRFGFFWRTFHQLHHAPQRLDIAGAALFHPLEIAVFVILSTIVTTLALGLDPKAAALTGFVAQFYSFFQHMNVRTPSWLGYFIQRPEAHFVHHQRDVHAHNYGDLPIWDIVFGTFKNPKSFGVGEVGLADPADDRYLAMLGFRDVSDGIGTRVQAGAPNPSGAPVADL